MFFSLWKFDICIKLVIQVISMVNEEIEALEAKKQVLKEMFQDRCAFKIIFLLSTTCAAHLFLLLSMMNPSWNVGVIFVKFSI